MLKVTKLTTQINIFGVFEDSLNYKHSFYLVVNSINLIFFEDGLNYFSFSDGGLS